jgi:hypothetical protein
VARRGARSETTIPIVIDTTLLVQSRNLDAISLNALRIVARARGLEIVVPSIALLEAESRRREEVETECNAIQRATSRLAGYSADFSTPQLPKPEEVAARWRSSLERTFRIAHLTPENAIESLRREALRTPPTRAGRGARDAAIWLTVLDVLTEEKKPGYFVSDNSKDFGDQPDQTLLHPTLAEEAGRRGVDVRYCSSLDALLGELTDAESTEWVTIERLSDEEGVTRAIVDTLLAHRMWSRLLKGRSATVRLRRILSSRAFRVGDRSVAVARIDCDLRFGEHDDESLGDLRGPFELRGPFQLWLSRPAPDAALGAEVTSWSASPQRIDDDE